MSLAVNPTLRTLTVAVTGASGSIFARHLLDALERDKRVGAVNLIFSDSGLRVIAEELGVGGRNEIVGKLLGHKSKKIHQQNNTDIGANVAAASVRP
jgi:4-hydroxy-3-polyprenylbenzoate decarboxylase